MRGIQIAMLAAAATALAGGAEDSIRRVYKDPPPREPKPDRAGAKSVETPVDPVEPPNDGEGIPNQLSIARDSQYYTSAGSFVGVIFDGHDVSGRVVEFNRDKGWVRLADVKPGEPLSVYQVTTAPRSEGVVQTFWRKQPSRQIRRQLGRIG